jgi:hypothetical protein
MLLPAPARTTIPPDWTEMRRLEENLLMYPNRRREILAVTCCKETTKIKLIVALYVTGGLFCLTGSDFTGKILHATAPLSPAMQVTLISIGAAIMIAFPIFRVVIILKNCYYPTI